MKKLFIIAASLMLMATATTSAEITREGKTFMQTSGERTEPKATTYTYKTKDGESYPIYLSVNGRAYIMRISKKSGKAYKYYLPEDIARTICKELGIEYKEKTTKK